MELISYRLVRTPIDETAGALPRICVKGKFVFAGNTKFYIRGVTYGPFRRDAAGSEYHDPNRVERDFSVMSSSGVNSVRTYTVPPRWLLDIAQRHALRVLVGLPWEEHVAFLDDKQRAREIEARVRAGVLACANHPAVFGYTVGNEIPSSIVRWYGPRRVEAFIARLCAAAKTADPGALVTYVNYPTTEYLTPDVDLLCFNVFLEAPEKLQAYLARLHNLAGDRPVLLSEVGLDSRRNGKYAQADSLEWQLRVAFEGGCAGAFVYAWTDEWHRGGYDIEDWDFGLIDRERHPKPALDAVGRAFTRVPALTDQRSPRISVVVCSYNGAQTLRDCLAGLQELEYPNFEVIVVDDGSNDATATIANEFGVRLIQTENCGLSCARNTGMDAATGDIIAYLDSDARPDPQWLTYLAHTFLTTKHAAVGGPNIAPPGDGFIADCIANSPGAPIHVLLSDTVAEHLPGCNLAIRKECLQAIGGFDRQFRVAGDDVDVCWRLQQRGWTLGFNPAAFVWHHARTSIRAYWKQQVGYGKAEALLQRKWPEKYNVMGHVTWSGRLYANGGAGFLTRPGIFYGTWGAAPFQSVYEPAPNGWWSLPLMPEWYLIIVALATLSAVGLLWPPLLLVLPALALAIGVLIAQGIWRSKHAKFKTTPPTRRERIGRSALTFFLHLLQPLARLSGRVRHGLTLWRRAGPPYIALPRRWTRTLWCEQWQSPQARLRALEAYLREEGAVVLSGGDFDRWDLEARAGTLGATRVLMAIEEHGGGKQFIRFLAWPKIAGEGLLLSGVFSLLALGAAFGHAWFAYVILAAVTFLLILHIVLDCATATAIVLHALDRAARANARENHQLKLVAVGAPASEPHIVERRATAGAARDFESGRPKERATRG